MATIVTRSGKGSPLTNTEVDANFTNLNNDKLETNAEVRAAVEAASDSNVFTDADHTKLDAIEANATADQTAAEILTAIKTVDGAGSGLDADTLDGVEAAALMPLSGGTMTGNLAYGDNVKATFGAGSDLQVFHDGLNSYIKDAGTGVLTVQSNQVRFQNSAGTEDVAFFNQDAAVKLYYDSAKMFETTATGVDVTGTVQADQFNNDEALPDIRPSLLLDFANSKTLDPRITFTRGSTATYYDGVTTAKAEENLLSYSQEFDNAAWTKGAASITANQLAAPDGTTTADLFTADGSSTQHYLSEAGLTFTADNYVFSIFAKKGTNDFFQIRFNTASGAGRANFDLNNGTTGGVSGVTATITDVGNGWYRCTAMEATNATTVGGVNLYLIGALTDAGAPTNTLSTTVYYWGAQLEQRSSATAYTPTTSAPVVKYQPVLQTAASGAARFDHDPVTGESKGLLIEEARTNINTTSEQVGVGYNTTTNASALDNYGIAPDGAQTADLLVEDTATGFHQIVQAYTGPTSGETWTYSVFVKRGNGSRHFALRLRDSFGTVVVNDNNAFVYFDLDTGTVSSSSDVGDVTLVGSNIEDAGNGWYRCSISGYISNLVASYMVNNFMTTSAGSGISYAGDGFSSMLVWGMQMEEGSFPTSYIATAGSTATRAADAAQVQNFDFNDGEGTVYCEGSIKFSTSVQSYARLWEITQDADANSRFNVFMNESGSDLNMGFVTQGTVYGGPTLDGSYTSGANVKTVVGYKLGENADVAEGGTLSQGSTPWITTGTSRNRLYLGSASGTAAWSNSYVRKFAYYSKLLSDATLKAMTTE